MSVQVISAVWQESKATGRARMVLLAIADMQGEIGAWPSIATLARMTNASERSIKRDIRELELSGELLVEYQQAPVRGQYRSNLYWVNLPSVAHLIQSSGVTDSVSGVTDGANRGDNCGLQTVTRTVTEPKRIATRLDESKVQRAEWLAWADLNFPNVDAEIELDCFIDYWMSKGSGATKTDWTATWRNWVRNVAKRSTTVKAKPERKTNLQKNLDLVQRLMAQDERKELGA